MDFHTFKVGDTVRLLEDIPLEGIKRGSFGAVLEVFLEPEDGYEIEFCDELGITLAQVALNSSQLELFQ